MTVIRGFAIAVLVFLLFLSLTLFGAAFTVKQTALNPHFLSTEVNKMPLADLAEQAIGSVQGVPIEFQKSLNKTVTAMETQFKQQSGAVVRSFYDYLLDQKPTLDLPAIVRGSLLSDNFASALIDNTDIPALAGSLLPKSNGNSSTQTVVDQLQIALLKGQSQIKVQLKAASPTLLDYLVNKKSGTDLLNTARATVLSNSMVNSLVDNMNIAPLFSVQLKQQLNSPNAPKEIQPFVNQIDAVIAKLEPQLKAQLKSGLPPILDYLVGKRNSFQISFDLSAIVSDLKAAVKQQLLQSPPLELAGIPTSQLAVYVDQFINQNLSQYLRFVPTTFYLDDKSLSSQLSWHPDQQLQSTQLEIAQYFREVETDLTDNLATPKIIIRYFQQYYPWLIVLLIALISGIAFIHHEARGAARLLGSTFLSYGLIEFGGVMAAKYYLPQVLPQFPQNMSALGTWVEQLVLDFFMPLQMFSLGVFIAGIILLVVSVVYPKRRVTT